MAARRGTPTAERPARPAARSGPPAAGRRPPRWRQALPLVVWIGSLLVGVVLFHALGSGPLAPPPLTDPSGWGEWAAARDPLVATVAVLRLVVLALAWYLVGVTTIGIVARLARAARLVRIADTLTVPMVRRLLQGALGLGLATAMVGAATPAAVPSPAAPSVASAAHHPGGEVHLTRADVDGAVDRIELTVAAPDDGVRLTRADAAPQAAPLPLGLLGASAEDGDGDGAADEVAMRRVGDGTAPAVHAVAAGESFWTIARDALASSGARPDDARIHGYWQRLVEHNRDVLDDPDNPDLLFPGQVVELPPLDGEGGRS